MWFFTRSTLDKSGASSVPARIRRMHTRIHAPRTSKWQNWQHDHEGEVTTMHLHRLHSASVAHPHAVTMYPSKYARKYVHFNQRSRAIAPSSLWPLISLICLPFMNSFFLRSSCSFYLSLFVCLFTSRSAYLQLYRPSKYPARNPRSNLS